MTKPRDDSSEDGRPRIRIQRRRLGKILQFNAEKSFGFIAAEDFRDDVFFHIRDWDGFTEEGKAPTPPEEGLWVEFELDDEHREKEDRLRAKIVRPTDRPTGRKLSGRDATFQIITHHPNARKKRPTWRE